MLSSLLVQRDIKNFYWLIEKFMSRKQWHTHYAHLYLHFLQMDKNIFPRWLYTIGRLCTYFAIYLQYIILCQWVHTTWSQNSLISRHLLLHSCMSQAFMLLPTCKCQFKFITFQNFNSPLKYGKASHTRWCVCCQGNHIRRRRRRNTRLGRSTFDFSPTLLKLCFSQYIALQYLTLWAQRNKYSSKYWLPSWLPSPVGNSLSHQTLPQTHKLRHHI